MTIPFLDLKRQYHEIKKEIDVAISRVVESQSFILGSEVSSFEENFAAYCGTKYAVGCSSGTDALILSLLAADIGPGHEVITTPFTFFATIEAILRVGAVPIFVDIDLATFNIDPLKIEAAISEKTRAIMPVHIFGQCSDMTKIKSIGDAHSLWVIEDAAQAAGAEWKGKKAGSIGELGCFSFFPAKNLGCFGDGGAVTTNDKALYEKMLAIRQHGMSPATRYQHTKLGGNFRLDAIQAAILNVKLKYLDEWNQKRISNATTYDSSLTGCKLPYRDLNGKHVYNQYTLMSEKRDEIVSYLNSKNISSMVYYPFPASSMKAIPETFRNEDMPMCKKACENVFSIPVYPDLKNEEICDIIESINKAGQ